MATIQKSDIIKQVAQSTGLTIKDTETTVNSFFNTVSSSLKSNDKVTFTGFGTFNAKNVAARDGRNPATGETIKISALLLQ